MKNKSNKSIVKTHDSEGRCIAARYATEEDKKKETKKKETKDRT